MPAGLHAVEASHISISSLSSFRAAIGRTVGSSKMPMASTPVLLNLLDGPVGVDPAYHIIWARFSARGHGPIHLLLASAAQIGFAWDGVEQVWVRESLPPLGMLAGPIQHFRSAILQAWHFKVTAGLAERDSFREVQFGDIKGSLQLLISPHL